MIKGGTATITGKLTASKDFNNIQFEANGCPSTGVNTSVKIVVPDAIVITQADVKENTIKGTQRGAIDLTVTGGSPKLSYAWTSDTFTSTITTEDLNNMVNGTYTVTITDANNCNITKMIKIPLNNPTCCKWPINICICVAQLTKTYWLMIMIRIPKNRKITSP